MTTLTLSPKSALVEANEYPSLSNFKLLYTTNKVDVMSDVLATIVIDDFRTDRYKLLSDNNKQLVQIAFNNKLSASNVVIDSATIDMCENNQMPVLASILRNYNAMTSVFSEAVEVLQPSNKATIVIFSEFGFPVAIQTTIDRLAVKPYAQHKESLEIIHKPKGKRNLVGNRLLPKDTVIVYAGWINVDIDSVAKTTLRNDSVMMVTQGNYTCFNHKYMSDLMSIIPETPILSLNV